MSLERAYVNCQRCYELVREITERNSNEEEKDSEILHKDQVYIARNEAMSALEDTADAGSKASIDLNVPISATISPKAIEGLKVCVGCDYSKPSIAELLKKEVKL